MPPFFQPKVPTLPTGINLQGKTAIVTGATAGIGLEICRQLLGYKLSTLVMAVRNPKKGETVREALLSDPTVTAADYKPTVKVLELDMESYESVTNFASTFKTTFEDLHLLIANAGIGTFNKELSSSKHEKNLQVNYLSNVALTLALLPLLEATAIKTGTPSKVSWTNSRQYALTSLAEKIPLKEGEGVIDHIDRCTEVDTLGRYADSKLCCVLFLRELAKHYGPDKVVINSFCPGLVDTGMTDVLPLHLRAFMKVLKVLTARTPDKAGWIALNAGVVAGANTHGKLLGDMEIEKLSEFVESEKGEHVQKLLWKETVDEMAGLVNPPAWFK